jgi:hypothetical protein
MAAGDQTKYFNKGLNFKHNLIYRWPGECVRSTEDEMQRAVYALNIDMKFNLNISANKIKTVAMKGKWMLEQNL